MYKYQETKYCAVVHSIHIWNSMIYKKYTCFLENLQANERFHHSRGNFDFTTVFILHLGTDNLIVNPIVQRLNSSRRNLL